MRQRKALVVRIWLAEDGRLQGQLSDPMSDWKRPFTRPDELWLLFQTFLAPPPSPSTNDADS